ncbi:MAG: hypothetical protein KF774_07585 [Planctomyces sp.]|nr:hypothetical protein [Planctomyces sp.]
MAPALAWWIVAALGWLSLRVHRTAAPPGGEQTLELLQGVSLAALAGATLLALGLTLLPQAASLRKSRTAAAALGLIALLVTAVAVSFG